jgi:glycosyltransferase involved in cell wall biosynthesis
MEKQVLSIVIPVFNEELWVEKSIRAVFNVELPSIDSKEVIVVDDFSIDGTRTILKRLKEELPFRLIELEKNSGKGHALRRGIQESTGTYIVFQDADLEYDPNDFNKMLVPLQSGKADAVYGTRFVGSEMRRLLFYWHEVGNRFLTFLTNMVTNLNFTDMETCYKMFVTKKLKELRLNSNRFTIEPEITIKAAKQNLKFYEVAISYNGRTYAQGKKINWRDGISALFAIVRYSLFG